MEMWRSGRQTRPSEEDRRLRAVLRQWQGIEPDARFEGDVWRRLRAGSVPGPEPFTLIGLLREWLTPPSVWVNGLASVAALVIGVTAAISLPEAPRGTSLGGVLLQNQTLARSYLALVAGDLR